jgi:hypothetical protein
MNYYVYVSRSKIEMLHGQLPKQGKRERSIGFDIKFLKADIKQSNDPNDSLYAKLSEVVGQLDEEGLIGDLQSSTHPFIRGSSCRMCWASYGMGMSAFETEVTFWGHSKVDFILALAGSKYNVLGRQQLGMAQSASMTDAIIKWLHENLGETFSRPASAYAHNYYELSGHELDADALSDGLHMAVSQIAGKENDFGFVAKVLHRGQSKHYFPRTGKIQVVLASPLYVSLEE